MLFRRPVEVDNLITVTFQKLVVKSSFVINFMSANTSQFSIVDSSPLKKQ